MNKTLIKNYTKLFPEINISKGYLDFDDKRIILNYYLKDINFNSLIIKNYVDELGSDIISTIKLVKRFKLYLNPSNKPGGSTWSIDYWIIRGWDNKYAESRVREIQSKNSQRSKLYWTSRGFSEEDAKENVSKIQSNLSKEFHKKLKQEGGTVSTWNINFWLKKNYSLEEAIEIVSNIQKSNGDKARKKYTKEELKTFHPANIEYWKRLHPEENYTKMLENYLFVRYSNSLYRSKIGDEFCDRLADNFKDNKLYFKENEFGKYIPNVGYRKYDYIDLTNMICVEFNGNYWHKENDPADIIKKEFIESLGFTYFVIWEKDYINNKELTLKKLIEEINYAVCKENN